MILSGAGLSAESGIPTYVDHADFRIAPAVATVMSAKGLAERPDEVHERCDNLRVALRDAQPNDAHRMIASLAEMYGDRITHLSQAVDDLVERAGYQESIKVHGTITSMRSLGDPDNVVDIGYRRYWGGPDADATELGLRFTCEKTGQLFRPDVVLSGEQSRLYHRMFLVMGALHPDDILAVIGTSGTSVPVNRWTANADCRRVMVNVARPPAIDESRFDTVIRMPAATAAFDIEELVSRHLDKATV